MIDGYRYRYWYGYIVLGFWPYWSLNWGLCGYSTTWAMPPAPFVLVILKIRSQLCLGSLDLLFCTSHHCWEDRNIPPCPVFIHWHWLLLLCLVWLWTAILRISVSQVARIAGIEPATPCFQRIFKMKEEKQSPPSRNFPLIGTRGYLNDSYI
jgi:hypothetical protein